jgi:hypothetical protein
VKTPKLPQTDSIEELARFWDSHDLTDFEDQLEEVTEPVQGPRAQRVALTEDSLTVDLMDGRTLVVPVAWFPRLWHGTPEERANFEIFGDGAFLHWPDLDEDLSVAGLLSGRSSGESPESLKKWLVGRKGRE